MALVRKFSSLLMSAWIVTVMAYSPGANSNSPQMELWRYSCDVFMYVACFRLPVGMTVEYRVPADYGMYRVYEGKAQIASFYVGMNPGEIKGSERNVLIVTKNYKLISQMQLEGDSKIINIIIQSKATRSMTIQMASEIRGDSLEALLMLISGLRPCIGNSDSGLKCSVDERWKAAMSGLRSELEDVEYQVGS